MAVPCKDESKLWMWGNWVVIRDSTPVQSVVVSIGGMGYERRHWRRYPECGVCVKQLAFVLVNQQTKVSQEISTSDERHLHANVSKAGPLPSSFPNCLHFLAVPGMVLE